MFTVIIFLIVLAVLIFVHELGHFAFAKLFGIRVDAFKIGFGPKIFAWTPTDKNGKKGETEYGLNLIPFGGYVKIFGETPDSESILGVDSKRSLIHKPKWQQTVVLVGGVLFNVLFALILYIGLFTHGVAATDDSFANYSKYYSNPRIMITDVVKNSPADKSGLKVGDVITSISNTSTLAVSTSTFDIAVIQNTIASSNGEPVILNIDQNGKIEPISITPDKSTIEGKYAVGIAMDNVVDMKLPFFIAIYEGTHYTINTFKLTVTSLYAFFVQIFEGKADFTQIAGPVGIAGIVGSAARLGLTYLLMITALISINLAVINLIPFPALDGGRILFVAIEAVIRRPIPTKFTNWVNLIGFSLLMLLMVVITYKDIIRIFIK